MHFVSRFMLDEERNLLPGLQYDGVKVGKSIWKTKTKSNQVR